MTTYTVRTITAGIKHVTARGEATSLDSVRGMGVTMSAHFIPMSDATAEEYGARLALLAQGVTVPAPNQWHAIELLEDDILMGTLEVMVNA